MTQLNRRTQRGDTLITWAFRLALLAFFVTIGMKLFPVMINQFKIQNAVKGVAQNHEITPQTSAWDVNLMLQRRWDIEDISALLAADVHMHHNNDKYSLYYEYENRVHLFYNIDVVASFSQDVPIELGAGGTEH